MRHYSLTAWRGEKLRTTGCDRVGGMERGPYIDERSRRIIVPEFIDYPGVAMAAVIWRESGYTRSIAAGMPHWYKYLRAGDNGAVELAAVCKTYFRMIAIPGVRAPAAAAAPEFPEFGDDEAFEATVLENDPSVIAECDSRDLQLEQAWMSHGF